MLNSVTYSQLTPAAARYLKQTEQPQPKYACFTCNKLKDESYCDCFQRPVDPYYNRCFEHSDYKPTLVVFKTPSNIVEIKVEEKKKNA